MFFCSLRQLATLTMLLIGSGLIPLYLVALALLSFFYQKCHVWKKESVSVGFVYDKSHEVKLKMLNIAKGTTEYSAPDVECV